MILQHFIAEAKKRKLINYVIGDEIGKIIGWNAEISEPLAKLLFEALEEVKGHQATAPHSIAVMVVNAFNAQRIG
jgi:hypothetical protein